ncbi:MAG: GTPase HflX [Oscillospiraceae bacterium]|nr:GTPase HflX [Oscillospiraceae bacterium]
MEQTEERQRAVLVAVDTGKWDAEESIMELAALCETAGADSVAEIIQQSDKLNPATYVGSGKAQEIRDTAERLEADIIVVDDSLSGVQVRNLEEITGFPVIDRTVLILDIFARNAKTAEGKLQVELAQLEYRLPRLMGSGGGLSQQGGGIGTRGPGETKLESDRRHIRSRIVSLKQKLEKMEERREITRRFRKRDGIPTVALVGYTNVGKSSLLNKLTGSDVLAEDKLFATLDPTVRRLAVGNLQHVLLVDTVGFVSRLPHGLVKAFKSTLDEVRFADLILLVADASSESWGSQLDVATEVLDELGCSEIPRIKVFNKCDLNDLASALPGIPVSARTGEGLDTLLEKISEALSESVVRCRLLFPFEDAGRAASLRNRGNILSEEWRENGLYVEATVERTIWPRFIKYSVTE